MAQDWHRAVFAGTHVPVPYYVGEVRDSDPRFPELIGYEVAVRNARGVASADVPAELGHFEAAIRAAGALLDPAIPVGSAPTSPGDLQGVLALAANAHGEWIYIHPFANGNGRTARLWVLWVSLRYGLPPFMRLKPRPEGFSYEAAAEASMGRRDHSQMIAVLNDMLAIRMGSGPGA